MFRARKEKSVDSIKATQWPWVPGEVVMVQKPAEGMIQKISQETNTTYLIFPLRLKEDRKQRSSTAG